LIEQVSSGSPSTFRGSRRRLGLSLLVSLSIALSSGSVLTKKIHDGFTLVEVIG
jgi:hypothetical protein